MVLDELLPDASAPDAKAELKRLKKSPSETLMQFVLWFRSVCQLYTQLNAQWAAHILFRKLPRDLQ